MDSPDRGSVKEATLARVAARRERHRGRSLFLRALVVVGGVLLALAGLLLLWAPEFGFPLLLAGFGLLALEFEWAARALAWTEWRALLLRHWFGRQPRPVKMAFPLLLIAVLSVVVWQVFF